MGKVLILSNSALIVYNFRLELVERLLEDKHEVWISSPGDERINDLKKIGCHHVETTMERHGKNPFSELALIHRYQKIVKEIQPGIVFSYTIKPNIYGAIACRSQNIPCVVNISGLGTAVENPGILQKITVALYKYAFTDVKKIFFQNTENMQFFHDRKIALGKYELLPGSGVNLEHFRPLPYPADDTIEFAFISRIMKEKGIDQYLDAAKTIHEKYPKTRFHVCGFCEPEYEGNLQEMVDEGIVIYHGMIKDVREIHKIVHCVVHPTYYPEGLSNTLLEACASARPIITTDRSGCREVIEDGVNGYVVEQINSQSLIEGVEKFIALPNEERRKMGLAGRMKVEKEFDRQIVVEAYMSELNEEHR